MKTQIVLVVLIALVGASSLIQEIQKNLAHNADHPFGKTMVSLLSVNMESGEPLQELRTLLQQIKDEILSLIQTQDGDWSSTQRRCQVDLAQLGETVRISGTDLDSYRTEKKTLDEEATSLDAKDKEDISSLERNTILQNQTEDRLDAENGDSQTRNQDYNDAIVACKEAQRLLMNLNTGSSLLEITEETSINLLQNQASMKKIQATLEKHGKKGSITLFQPIIEGLLEMSTKLDHETLANILNLIARLIAALQEAQDQEDSTHENSVSNIEKLQFDTEAERNTLQNSIQSGISRLGQVNARLNELDGLITNSADILKNTQSNLDETQNLCDTKSVQHNKQEVNRETELDILERLLEFVSSRIIKAL